MLSFPKPQMYTAVAEAVIKASQKVYVARFRMAEPIKLEFIAGQYGSFFLLEADYRRNFSFASSPSSSAGFEICADITPMGPGSKWLINLKPGDPVRFLAPLGRFVVDKTNLRKKIFIATGTGIAPIRSMIYNCLETLPGIELFLYWGLRYEEDMFWDEEFDNLAKVKTDFKYTFTLSQGSEGWSRMTGRVTSHFYSEQKDLLSGDYYLCGNRPITDDIARQLIARNVPKEQIHTELFF